MPESTDHPTSQPSPHNPRTCPQCRSLTHPAQARAGRALTRHLTEHPFPGQRQAARS